MRDGQDREGSISYRTFAITERNTGIDGTRPDPTASRQSLRDNHRSGALTALMLLGFAGVSVLRVNSGTASDADRDAQQKSTRAMPKRNNNALLPDRPQ